MEELTWSAFIAVTISSLIAFIFQIRLNKQVHQLEQKIQYQQMEHDKLMKKLDEKYSQRMKSEIVAELFAKWHSSSSNKEELNKLSYQCSLWLPNEIIKELNLRLTNDPNAKQLQEILVMVRKHLNPNMEEIEWTKIVYWE